MNHLSIPSAAPLGPAAQFSRLVPDKIVDWLGHTAYWFKRGAGKGTDFAMIIKDHGKTTFRLQYYPLDGGPQIVTDLALDMLPAAIDDLIGAGFPVARTAAPPSSQTGRPALSGSQLTLSP
jgi:hypothetical protein